MGHAEIEVEQPEEVSLRLKAQNLVNKAVLDRARQALMLSRGEDAKLDPFIDVTLERLVAQHVIVISA